MPMLMSALDLFLAVNELGLQVLAAAAVNALCQHFAAAAAAAVPTVHSPCRCCEFVFDDSELVSNSVYLHRHTALRVFRAPLVLRSAA